MCIRDSGSSEATYPVFSKDGKYVFFTASTNYGRSVGWLDMSSFENPIRNNIYAIHLAKETPSILIPESDEEVVKSNDSASKAASPSSKIVKIDFDGIEQRIVALPMPEKNY